MNLRVFNALRKEAKVGKLTMLGRKLGLLKMPKGGLGSANILDGFTRRAKNYDDLDNAVRHLGRYKDTFKDIHRDINKALTDVNLPDSGLARTYSKYLLTKDLNGLKKAITDPVVLRAGDHRWRSLPTAIAALRNDASSASLIKGLQLPESVLKVLKNSVAQQIAQVDRRDIANMLRGPLVNKLMRLFG